MSTYQIESIQFDSQKQLLINHQSQVSLRQKVAAALTLLVQANGSLVNQETFLQQIWPDTHVDERALPQVITELRSAIEEVGGNRKWIRTVPKQGYALDVLVIQKTAPLPIQIRSPKRKTRQFHWLLTSPIIMLLAIVIWRVTAAKSGHTSVMGESASIAILPFINESNDSRWDWTKLALMDMVRANLLTKIHMIDSTEVVSEITRLGLGEQMLTTSSHLTLKHNLGNPILVAGIIRGQPNHWQLEIRWLSSAGVQSVVIDPLPEPLHVGAITDLISRHLHLDIQQSTQYPFKKPYLRDVYVKGLSLMLAGSMDEAVPYFEICHEQDPSFWHAGFYLARCLVHGSRFEEADRLIQELVTDNPYLQIELDWLKAQLTYEKRDLHACLALVDKLMQEPKLSASQRIRALTILGTIHTASNQLDTAELELKEALRVSQEQNNARGEVTSHKLLASLYQRNGRTRESLDHLEKALPIAKAMQNSALESGILLTTGDYYFYSDNFAEARRYYQQVLELRLALNDRRGVGVALAYLGSVAIFDRRFEDAQRQIQAALEINIETNDRYNAINQRLNLGYLAMVTQDYATSLTHYAEAETSARNAEDEHGTIFAIIGLSECYMQAGNLAQAAEQLHRARLIDSSDTNFLNARLLLYEAAVDYGLGNAAIALDKQLKARGLMDAGDWDQGKEDYLHVYQLAATSEQRLDLPFKKDPLRGPDP